MSNSPCEQPASYMYIYIYVYIYIGESCSQGDVTFDRIPSLEATGIADRDRDMMSAEAQQADAVGTLLALYNQVAPCVAVCCRVLQCVGTLLALFDQVAQHSVLQCVAVFCSMLQCVAVCCSMLQCVAVCCSVLQYVAVCCSVLQYVAVCCSMLQFVFCQRS